jgi:hypothetical protein
LRRWPGRITISARRPQSFKKNWPESWCQAAPGDEMIPGWPGART